MKKVSKEDLRHPDKEIKGCLYLIATPIGNFDDISQTFKQNIYGNKKARSPRANLTPRIHGDLTKIAFSILSKAY